MTQAKGALLISFRNVQCGEPPKGAYVMSEEDLPGRPCSLPKPVVEICERFLIPFDGAWSNLINDEIKIWPLIPSGAFPWEGADATSWNKETKEQQRQDDVPT